MKVAEYLEAKKQLIEPEVAAFSKEFLESSASDYSEQSRQVLEAYCSVLQRGGKRLRGALVMTAYEMLGGTDQKLSVQVAAMAELVHASLLVIDDICDRSLMRRGGPAAHVLLADQHRAEHLKGDSEHFGLSQAINAALLALHTAEVRLSNLSVAPEVRLSLLRHLNQALATTLHGQINDIYNEALPEVTESQVEAALSWKTAYYSFINPLHMGAMLAEADPVALDVLKAYGRHVGLAFQVGDDILGTFGNTFESGKSSMDDLKEGKVTLLISKALERANQTERRQLLEGLGNPNLTPPQHETCRKIIEQTGALDYARQTAHQHAAKAAAALDQAPKTWQAQDLAFLRDLAAFVGDRRV